MDCTEADKKLTTGRKGRTFVFTLTATVIWLSMIVGAMVWINDYTTTPGVVGTVPGHWPVATKISLDKSRPTLILFAHPHCPCTRATIGELERLMADGQGKLTAQVIFIQPLGLDQTWTYSDLWRTASAIPGVTVTRDVNGVEAHRFQAGTSGETLLYDPAGQLLFQGGITLARGHSGDNPGRSALLALVQHEPTTVAKTPVYGCSLFEETCEEGGKVCKQ